MKYPNGSEAAPDHFLHVPPEKMAQHGIVGSMSLRHPDVCDMHEALEALISKVAGASNPPVLIQALRPNLLITGQTGTGKELVATAFRQRLIDRKILKDDDDHFGAVNCACLSGELLEIELFGSTENAFTGAGNLRGLVPRLSGYGEIDPKKHVLTGKPKPEASLLFLDEIGATSLEVQAKILRLIENRDFSPLGVEGRHYDAPHLIVLAATNELDPQWDAASDEKPDPSSLGKRPLGSRDPTINGRFRRDLFYRLGDTFHFHLPPLKERKDEIPRIAEQFYQRYFRLFFDPQQKPPLPAALTDILQRFDWPGNGRQLHQVIRRAMIRWDGQQTEGLVAHVRRECVPAN